MADESKGVLGHLPPLPRKAVSNAVIAMEQAYRQRKGLPLLSDTDIEALKAGEPMPWERGDGGSSTATTVATSVPAAPAESAPPAGAAGTDVATVVAVELPPSPRSHGIGSPAFSASISVSLRRGRPFL